MNFVLNVKKNSMLRKRTNFLKNQPISISYNNTYLSPYHVKQIQNIISIPKRDRRCLDAAIQAAFTSRFAMPKKLGSCILCEWNFDKKAQ